MSDTFSREDLAKDTGTAEAQADEAADETVGENEVVSDEAIAEAREARTTRPTAEQADAMQREAAERVELVDDEEIPDLSEEPMPDLSDPDINYDNDRYRERTQQWIKKQARREVTATKLNANIDSSCAEFAKTHKDWNAVVRDNKVLQENQLHPLAGAAVGGSKLVAEILYAFGKDPAYAIAVAAMPPARQLLEVGKLKQRIVARKSRAPAATATPTRTDQGAQRQQTLTRKAAAPSTRDEQMKPGTSMQDFVQRDRLAREAQRQANRKARGLGK
jgi:hypothetical protein